MIVHGFDQAEVWGKCALMKIKLTLATLMIYISPHFVLADQENTPTVDELRQRCASGNSNDELLCRGYLDGAIDGLDRYGKMTGQCYFQKGPTFSYQEARKTIINYLTSHRERGSEKAAYVVGAALAGAYPCPK